MIDCSHLNPEKQEEFSRTQCYWLQLRYEVEYNKQNRIYFKHHLKQ